MNSDKTVTNLFIYFVAQLKFNNVIQARKKLIETQPYLVGMETNPNIVWADEYGDARRSNVQKLLVNAYNIYSQLQPICTIRLSDLTPDVRITDPGFMHSMSRKLLLICKSSINFSVLILFR